MLDSSLVPLTFAAALGSGLMAGVFFAFSTFVMKALGRLPAHEGISAMQAINIAVINPLFMVVFLGTGVLCVAVAILTVMRWDRPGAGWLMVGCGMYLLGTLLVTIAFNVPLNNALAKLSPTDPDAASQWANYLSRWTLWNHVRTICPLAGLGAFIVALIKH